MAAAWHLLLLPSARGWPKGVGSLAGRRGNDYLAASPIAQDQSVRRDRYVEQRRHWRPTEWMKEGAGWTETSAAKGAREQADPRWCDGEQNRGVGLK